MHPLKVIDFGLSLVALSVSRYFDFKNRSSRAEFFVFTSFILFLQVIAIKIDANMMGISFVENIIFRNDGPLARIISIVTFIPALSVSVRRLHDVNKSGWNMLLIFTIIGIIPIIYWHCKKGDIVANKYGVKPLKVRVFAKSYL